MKLVSAIIKPHKLDAVREALSKIDVQGMTVTEVKGTGSQKGHKEVYRGAEFEVDFLLRTKVDIVVVDENVDRVVSTIRDAAITGKVGDGKIFVFTVENAVRIRTGETDREAFQLSIRDTT
jgi:nitrogen regulatory protein P-II 2